MAKIKKLSEIKETAPKRKRGRPPKPRAESVDYRITQTTDPRLVEMKARLDTLVPGSNQLEAARREYFSALLDAKLDIETRVDLLVALAKKDDAKSAPVALKALQDINEATKLKDVAGSGAASIFVLPAGTAVAVRQQPVIDVDVAPQLEAGDGVDMEDDEPAERW